VVKLTFPLAAGLVLCAVTLTYANHFHNSFQFDDQHTIRDNIYIRSLGNIPKFFSDAATLSVNPLHRSWRPLVPTTLAIDYWLGGGLRSTFYFHLSTFLWFLLQLLLMYWLYDAILARAKPGPGSLWAAWLAVAWYGLHPAIAETINYIIQRGDVLSTLGVVAAMVVYARFPKQRKYGLYLAPFVLGVLAKPPALIFPLLLLAYVALFEEGQSILRKSAPAIAVSLAMAVLVRGMTAKTFLPDAAPAYGYLITQPYVALRYFASFFLPIHLTADSDLQAFASLWHLEVIGGFLFVGALLVAIWATARRPQMRPIAFGLIWFLVALLPTSLYPLFDVENDHRMYFPFVGLAIAVVWGGKLLLEHWPRKAARWVTAAALLCLAPYALGTRERNMVWHTEESLWHDVTIKSPRNARGLMNYGLALMGKGEFTTALSYFNRAAALAPDYSLLEINLGNVNGALHRDVEAERHYRRAIQLDPRQAEPYFNYARWLDYKDRDREAADTLKTAIGLNPVHMGSRYTLLYVYAKQGQWDEVTSLAENTLKVAPGDVVAAKYLAAKQKLAEKLAAAEALARSEPTPEHFMALSSVYRLAGRHADSAAAAEQAARLRAESAK
jgi:Tfp pilus assembly protein PilF